MAGNTSITVNVRFAVALPDLSLPIPRTHHTCILSLICKIRERLPTAQASLRLRLIYAGRVLAPADSIATALRLGASPAPSRGTGWTAQGTTQVHQSSAPPSLYYVHATFSDALTPSALAAEETEAVVLDSALLQTLEQNALLETAENRPGHSQGSTALNENDHSDESQGEAPGTRVSLRSRAASTTSQAPQGFDRLLGAGLSPLEVASLRSQFVAILAHTHTPDTMPGAGELRILEERWLDNDHDGSFGGATRSGGPGMGSGISEEDTGGLEDMLWGNIMGFFWPIGAVIWLMREEGVWTQRRRLAVVTGALVNFAFSVMRVAS